MTELTNDEIDERVTDTLNSFNDIEKLGDVMIILYEVVSQLAEMSINDNRTSKAFRMWCKEIVERIDEFESERDDMR